MARSQPSSRSGPAVALQHVVRRYPAGSRGSVTAIDDLSLSIDAGGLVAVSGPSGSGKSTLLALLGGLERPNAGAITVGERELSALGARELAVYRRGLGVILQRCNLLPALTALDNVIAPVLPVKTPFDKAVRGRELLAVVGLRGRERELPAELSEGEQQRVAIARALINRPVLLLADEPTGNLDARAGRAIVDLLLDLHRQDDLTMIIATHDTAVASRCDRILRLVDGSLRDDIEVRAASDPMATRARLERFAPR